jgi:hypothetical protein
MNPIYCAFHEFTCAAKMTDHQMNAYIVVFGLWGAIAAVIAVLQFAFKVPIWQTVGRCLKWPFTVRLVPKERVIQRDSSPETFEGSFLHEPKPKGYGVSGSDAYGRNAVQVAWDSEISTAKRLLIPVFIRHDSIEYAPAFVLTLHLEEPFKLIELRDLHNYVLSRAKLSPIQYGRRHMMVEYQNVTPLNHVPKKIGYVVVDIPNNINVPHSFEIKWRVTEYLVNHFPPNGNYGTFEVKPLEPFPWLDDDELPTPD